MAARALLPPRVAALFLAAIAEAAKDGQTPSGAATFRLLKRAIDPLAPQIAETLSGGTARHGADGWMDLTITPAPNFRAVGCAAGTPVAIQFSVQSGRFISSAAPSARIGIGDLAAHVWHVRAPETRGSVEQRLLALLGLAYLRGLADPAGAAEAAEEAA
ncbi:hypothetical protein [Methyloferula stellata]|uniref:hypothetical protein n=1 Tax=Methyloferula stellata TaxID=876270 RepID=UPI000379ACD6|nr:hypothetical protein [Methyloferula stellata]